MEYHSGKAIVLSPPPRHVPLGLRISLLFGGALSTIGWLFIGFGGIFFWVFALNADYSFITFAGEKIETTGIVTRSESTRATENNRPIYANHYRYIVNGTPHDAVSFTTGHKLTKATHVTVEYLRDDPRRARIKNVRTAMFPPFVAFVALFPLLGLGLVAMRFRYAGRAIRLLKRGFSARGKLVAKIPTAMQVNGQTVSRLRFDFTAPDGRTGSITVRTHRTAVLEDDAHERLLYDPYDIDNGVIFDELPDGTEIAGTGQLVFQKGRAALGNLVLPSLTVAGHGWWLYSNYLI